jgi:hypothetical protein
VPPLPGVYNSSFTVGGTVGGFDVRGDQGSYIAPVEANQTVEPIPWSQSYSVVRHYGGLNPHKRQYRGVVYLQSDFDVLALLVGGTGNLVTPRQPSAVLAALDRVDPGPDFDRTDPLGLISVQLSFTLLQ